MAYEKEVTLVLRRLPNELTDNDFSELLANFGAVRCTTIMRNNQNKNMVHATFPDKQAAEIALSRLHQLRVLGRRLLVEFASESELPAVGSALVATSSQSQLSDSGLQLDTNASEKPLSFRDDLHRFSQNLNAIGRSFGLDYPMSPKLYYSYPRPNSTILSNIGSALLAVPRFYTQVLHLMNKMNLPAPFGPVISAPEFEAVGVKRKDTEDDESELESDPEMISDNRPNDAVSRDPRLRPPPQQTPRPKKKARLQLMEPEGCALMTHVSESTSRRPEEVFELAGSQSGSKRIQFKLDVKLTAASDDSVATDAVKPVVEKSAELTVEVVSEPALVSEKPGKKPLNKDDLLGNRLSKEDMEVLPVFKNYKPGAPTRRLYLKNLAKQVDEEDLRTIYGHYVDMENKTFDVRLMREGRMKGQAFITFASEENAQTALCETNGFVVHGKPIVVQFAKCDKDN